MKTTYLFLVFLLIGSLSTHAQTVIEWDFPTGDVQTYKDGVLLGSNARPVGINKFVTVRVTNVNTFKYAVKVTGRNVDLSTPISSELQAIFRLPREDKVEKTEIVEAAAETETEVGNMNKLSTAVTPAIDSDLDTKMNDLTSSCTALLSSTKAIATMRVDRMILISLVQQEWKDAAELKLAMQLEGIGYGDRSTMRSQYEGYIKDYEAAEKAYDAALGRAGTLLAQATGALKAKRKAVKEAEADLVTAKATNIAATIVAAEAKKSKAVQDTVPEFKDFSKMNGIYEQIETAKKKIKHGYELIESDQFLQMIEDIFSLQTAIDNENSFTVVSGPLQMKGDFANFEVSAVPRKVNALLPIVAGRTANFDVPTVGGWKVDFSAGPTMSFGDGAKDELFFLEPDATGDNVTLVSVENENVIRPGIASLMHFYTRKGTDRAFAGLFGVGAEFKTIDDPDLSLYLGASLVLGKSRKVMINAGLSFLRVDRLQSRFEVGQVYPTDDISLDDVTDKVFKTSAFIGVSYNITNRSTFN